MTGVQAFGGIVRVTSEMFEDREKVWPGKPGKVDPYPWRFETEPEVVLEEDDRQPCLHSRSSLEVTAWLRVLAYNLLSAWRTRLPLKDRLPVAWARACETLRDALVHGRAEVPQPTLA